MAALLRVALFIATFILFRQSSSTVIWVACGDDEAVAAASILHVKVLGSSASLWGAYRLPSLLSVTTSSVGTLFCAPVARSLLSLSRCCRFISIT